MAAPPVINFGTWSQPTFGTTYPSGSAASLTCSPGYSVSPPGAAAYVLCTNGVFGTPTASCALSGPSTVQKCSAPPVMPNGVWENPFAQASGFTVGSTVSLNCNPGFKEQPAGAALQCGSALGVDKWVGAGLTATCRSEEHTSELQSLE